MGSVLRQLLRKRNQKNHRGLVCGGNLPTCGNSSLPCAFQDFPKTKRMVSAWKGYFLWERSLPGLEWIAYLGRRCQSGWISGAFRPLEGQRMVLCLAVVGRGLGLRVLWPFWQMRGNRFYCNPRIRGTRARRLLRAGRKHGLAGSGFLGIPVGNKHYGRAFRRFFGLLLLRNSIVRMF